MSDDMVCQESVEVVTEYLEGALSSSDRIRLEAHLLVCPGCVTYIEQMRSTKQILGSLTPETLPEGNVEELLAVFRRWKQEQS